jgi:3',5'-cyclic AMP phosphodiesterase CpdA
MKIVVLSDLHTGTASIAQDFTLGDSTNGVKLGYLDDFKAIVEKENIKADYLIVPGDITHRAEHLEFELAASNIQQCAEILNVPAENVFLYLVIMIPIGLVRKNLLKMKSLKVW